MRKDTLAVLPTGSGKSAIYQLAGLLLAGLTVVISPLVALQRDQVLSLSTRRVDGRAVRVVSLSSLMNGRDRAAALRQLRAGMLDFLLLGPEQLANPETHGALIGSARPVALVTVDEAHLISEWGHDFRPEYRQIAPEVQALGRPPILALTATAAPPVQADITRSLGMRDPAIVVADFDRPNIHLSVRRAVTHAPEEQAIADRTVEIVLASETPALVYSMSHSRCEDIADRLRKAALRAAAYHAGLSAAQRARVQEDYFGNRLDVVVATSAFGMGIDKHDVRTVVHAGVAASVDEYYQEIGRAGRDGQSARAVLVYDPRTLRIPRLFAARSRIPHASVGAVVKALAPAGTRLSLGELVKVSKVSRPTAERIVGQLEELGLVAADQSGISSIGQLPAGAGDYVESAAARRQIVLGARIDSIRHYAETVRCRRAELLAYFGEAIDPPCRNCDNDDETPSFGDTGSFAGESFASGTPRPFARGTPQPFASGTPRPTTPPGPASASGDSHRATRVSPGVPVLHRLWGRGILLAQDEHELVVVFESMGYRHLSPAALASGVLRVI